MVKKCLIQQVLFHTWLFFTPHVLIVTLLQVEAMLCAATPQGKELSLIAVAQHNHYIYCVIALKGDLEVLCLPSDLYTCLVGKCN